MKRYTVGTVFKKSWEWFAVPHEVAGVAIANFFSYEPVDILGFKRAEGLTTAIDLSRTSEDIWANMRKRFVREQIERGQRRGVVAGASNDFSAFQAMYQGLSRTLSFDTIAPGILQENGILFLAHYEGKPIAGGVFIGDGTFMRALALASTRHEGGGRMRDIVGGANRLVIWEAIRYAKAHGYSLFDLGGIAPDSENPGTRAIAVFKEAFGGERRRQYYYAKIYSPLLRLWMRVRRFL